MFLKKRKQVKEVVIKVDVYAVSLEFIDYVLIEYDKILALLEQQKWEEAFKNMDMLDLINLGDADMDYTQFPVCVHAFERAKLLIKMECYKETILEMRIARSAGIWVEYLIKDINGDAGPWYGDCSVRPY